MSRESVIFGIAGVFFGILVGWMLGSQQTSSPAAGAAAVAPAPTAAAGSAQAQTAAPFDEARAAALRATAEKNASDAGIRVQLGDLYFDAERFADASQWYEAALEVDPRNVNASTDLGITYYYMNQADRALAQFDRSLALDPRHTKTLLNIGIVRAFAKQDLEGAAKVWQQVVEVAPDSQEARMARQALEGLRSAHPESSPKTPPGDPQGK
ncbi:MAG: tetratricopeptide repeat protein [Vicinamibacterales bacterium]